MPTNRTAIRRNSRPLRFPAEALSLFAELDKVPMRRRDTDEFKRRDRELHRLLDLGHEWFCCSASVLDRDKAPCYPEGMPARDAWFKVRAVRDLLLEAVKEAPR